MKIIEKNIDQYKEVHRRQPTRLFDGVSCRHSLIKVHGLAICDDDHHLGHPVTGSIPLGQHVLGDKL